MADISLRYQGSKATIKMTNVDHLILGTLEGADFAARDDDLRFRFNSYQFLFWTLTT